LSGNNEIDRELSSDDLSLLPVKQRQRQRRRRRLETKGPRGRLYGVSAENVNDAVEQSSSVVDPPAAQDEALPESPGDQETVEPRPQFDPGTSTGLVVVVVGPSADDIPKTVADSGEVEPRSSPGPGVVGHQKQQAAAAGVVVIHATVESQPHDASAS